MSERKSNSNGGITVLQLPTSQSGSQGSSSSSSQPIHKRDIVTVVKGLKNHAKNPIVARDYVAALQARLFEDSSRDARDSLAKFILNQTGGISTLLSAMEYNSGDVTFSEVALVFLYNLLHAGGKRNPRIVVKVVKRGGGRICVAMINKNPANLKVVHPATMVVIAIGTLDSKLPTLARLTGCFGNLLGLCKQHMVQPKPSLASVLCCLSSLCRGDMNSLHLWKRGAVPIVLDICVKNMLKDGSAVLRWACDLLCRMCHLEENAKEVAREGGIALTLSMCYEQCSAVDVQGACIELLRLLIMYPEGLQQFQATGGFPYLLTLITENNAEKSESEWLLLVNQLYSMYDITDLPVPVDSDLVWVPPEYDDPDENPSEIASPVTQDPTGSGAGNVTGVPNPAAGGDNPHPNAGIRYENFSPELFEGDIPEETSIACATVVHHVKPFTDPRPSPSCPTSIDFVPPVEELLTQTPQQRVEVIKRQLRRLTHANMVIMKVVYDDQPRDTTLPSSKLTTMSHQAMLPTPPPPPVTNSRASLSGASSSNALPGSSSTAIPTLRFGSNFECGNLKRAIQVFDDEYDLILQPDVNTSAYTQWFYFSIENTRSDVTYKFNILNMEKPSSTFNEGQRPLIFSEKRFTWSGFGWLRSGHDICYFKNSYKRAAPPGAKRRRDGGSGYFTLSFSVRFPHDDDRVYIANCYPYSYSDLIGYLRKLQERRALDDCLMVQSLCTTQSGNIMPLVTITSLKQDGAYCSAEDIAQRGVVIISSRVHPGETNASYMCKGVLDFLLDVGSEHAQYLRNNFVWKIIPMLNPDGVVNGNHRCSLSGKDLNREFINPDKILNPTIFHLKELAKHIKIVEGRNVALYGDFHGHSRCRNFIIFACSARKPTCGIIPEKIFPRVLSDLAPYFSYPNCTYKVQRSKRTTGRVVFYKELGIRMSFTLEGSMMGGTGCDFVPLSFGDVEEDICRRGALTRMTNAHFNTAHYQTLGAMFVKTLLLIRQADQGINTKVNDVVSELLAEANGFKKGSGPSGAATARTVAENSSLAAGDDGIPCGGSYATARRHSRRRKTAAQIPAATPAELQEIYKTLLRGSTVSRVSLADGDDDDDGDDGDDMADDDEMDSDGGNAEDDGAGFDDDPDDAVESGDTMDD